MLESLAVSLAQKSYPILFLDEGAGALVERLASAKAGGRRVAVLTDKAVWQAVVGPIRSALAELPRLEVDPGEQTKSLEIFGRVLDFMAAQRLDRTSVLVVLGGGVVGDLGGYAAASYLRGIDFIQVPTTLLAMVDSSVGGKTGINLSAGKNLVGAFHHPSEVFIIPACLATLPAREFAAGMAEVIKYGLLGDADLFAQLERAVLTPRSPELAAVIRRCCAMKAAVVQADERETAKEGGRALLNLGHTFGHAIEQVAGYGTYLHGEAVGIGLAGAARLSARLGLIDATVVERVERAVAAHGLPVRLRQPIAIPALIEAMFHDKKVRSGKLRFVVLEKLGRAATRGDIDVTFVDAVWRELGGA